MRILGICGSLQARSGNLSLLELAGSLLPEGASLVLYDGLRSLPHFNPDLEAEGGAPESVRSLRREVAASDALLIACPEYGHSLPGALKNAIDWLIGSGELERKVIAVTASTVGHGRGVMGLAALKVTLGAVSARIVGGEPLARGAALEADLRALLEALAREVQLGAP